MSVYDKPIMIQAQDQDTEIWVNKFDKSLHAKVNKTQGGTVEGGGAGQYRARLTFELRYMAALEDLRYRPQLYRILYRGHTFRVADYDDYMEQRRTIRLVGEFYE